MLLFSMVENEKDLSKFQRIYDQYKNMMYWVAYDITKNTHDAEDVVQLSLIKLIDILYRIEEEEIEQLKEKGAHIVTLGKRILRTETAGFVATSLIQYELSDLGGND